MRVDLPPDVDLVALVRGAGHAESLVVVIAPGRDPLALATARAALAPLAIERAPHRVNAVLPLAGADPAAVDAAVAFLERAASTTGQLIEVSPPQPPGAARTAPAR